MMNCYHLWWTCGPYKACAAELMADFLREHQNKREIARARLSEYDSLGVGVVFRGLSRCNGAGTFLLMKWFIRGEFLCAIHEARATPPRSMYGFAADRPYPKCCHWRSQDECENAMHRP